jgi:hypothetical protein
VEGSCEHGNELSGCIKFWEVLEWLHDCGFSRRAHLHGVSSNSEDREMFVCLPSY